MPNSAEVWDEMGVPLPEAIRDATITNPLTNTVDYYAELAGLYTALGIRRTARTSAHGHYSCMFLPFLSDPCL